MIIPLVLAALAAADEPIPVLATTYYRTFSHAHPVLKQIKPGETVATKTIDSGGQDEKGVKRSEPVQPADRAVLGRGGRAGRCPGRPSQESAAQPRLGLVAPTGSACSR